jgi:hypothetical protein
LSGRPEFKHPDRLPVADGAVTGLLSGVAGSAHMVLGMWAAKRLIAHELSKALERYMPVRLLIVISVYMVLHG